MLICFSGRQSCKKCILLHPPVHFVDLRKLIKVKLLDYIVNVNRLNNISKEVMSLQQLWEQGTCAAGWTEVRLSKVNR